MRAAQAAAPCGSRARSTACWHAAAQQCACLHARYAPRSACPSWRVPQHPWTQAAGLGKPCRRQLLCAALSGSPANGPLPQVVDVEVEPAPALRSDGMLAPGGDIGGPGRPPSLLQKLALLLLRLLRRAARAVQSFLGLLGFQQNWRLSALALTVGVGLAAMLGAHLGVSRPLRPPPREVVYSDFLTLVRGGAVRSARIDEDNSRVYFELRRTAPDAAAGAVAAEAGTSGAVAAEAETGCAAAAPLFYAKRIADPGLIPALVTGGVEFGAIQAGVASAMQRALLTVVALWLPLLPFFFIMRHVIKERSGMSKKNGSSKTQAPRVTFRDVAGVDAAKEELLEVVACLRDAKRYARLNARMPSGVLLSGPPGTGKTLLARAVAGEAGVPFFSCTASEFVELFVGRGAARIRELFAEARKRAPAVVFIDELDAVGARRGAGMNEERDQTLNQLLTELDGFEGRQGILLLAATNRPEVLDPALTRPGRLSRRVAVPLPDEPARAAILGVHLRGTPLAPGSDRRALCNVLARLTGGLSGAELANVVNEAALLAGRRGAEVVSMRELGEAVQRTRYGINGGAALLPGRGLRRRLGDWLLDTLAPRRIPARTLGSA